MARYSFTVILWALLALPAAAATNVIYPTSTWNVSTHQGEDIGGGLYHMGIDVAYNFPAGTPVYSVSEGVVKEAVERSQFGLVVLIEQNPEGEDPNVALYGHLDPGNILVEPGQVVHAGDLIGTLGSPEVNGGWSVHLHFGIHKGAYTGDWVYYGHVRDAATGEQWINPETYIPEHFTQDNWNPVIDWDAVDGTVIGNNLFVNATVGDIGSAQLSYVRVKILGADNVYETVRSVNDPDYNFQQTVDISNYPDGLMTVQLLARDAFGNKQTVTKTFTKDPYRFTTPALVSMTGSRSDALLTQWSYGGTVLNSFLPFKADWNQGGLLAIGHLDEMEESRIVAIRPKTSDTAATAKVFNSTGELLRSFELLHKPKAITISPGQLWVADNTGVIAVYDANGGILKQSAAFSERTWTGISVNGETIMACSRDKQVAHVVKFTTDLAEEKQWRAFKQHTGCRIALADVTGDAVTDVVLGTTGKVPGLAKVTKLGGKVVIAPFAPFGDAFMGKIDVSTTQWDTTEDSVVEEEVLFSQGSNGQAWVKAYRLSGDEEIIFTELLDEDAWQGGSLVAGWQ